MPIKARAFSPAGISSFFQICDRTPNGTLITDPERIGSRGGGFVINKGVLTEVTLTEAKEKQIKVLINGKHWPKAETTKTVVETFLAGIAEIYHVTVRHQVAVPIGAGFGSSAAGALGTSLAISKALDVNLTSNQLGRIAHVAEVKCLTGLGTVGPIMQGGCIITTDPGSPGYSSIDRIPISSDYRIVAGTFRPFPTKGILSSHQKREEINEWGHRTLDKIISTPSLENFMQACKEFALGTGLVTNQVRSLIKLAEKAGAVGATQNMVGEAVHALVTEDKLESVVQAFRKVMPVEKLTVASIDLQGARPLS